MKLLISLFVAVSMYAQAQASEQNEAYFQIKKVSVKEVADNGMMQPMATAFNQCDGQGTKSVKPQDVSGLTEVGIFLDQIINLGKKVWNIIAEGTPVVDLKFDTANALPTGIKCWTELQGWAAPQTKLYHIVYENGLGMDVVDFMYRVSFIPKGNYQGQGQFITNAVVQPASVNVAWGFKFNAAAEVPVVFNQGTSQNPLAGLQMNVHWSVDNLISHDESTETFFLNGAGTFQKMN